MSCSKQLTTTQIILNETPVFIVKLLVNCDNHVNLTLNTPNYIAHINNYIFMNKLMYKIIITRFTFILYVEALVCFSCFSLTPTRKQTRKLENILLFSLLLC